MSHSLNGKDDGHDNGLVFDQKTLRMRPMRGEQPVNPAIRFAR